MRKFLALLCGYALALAPQIASAQMWPNPGPGHAAYSAGGGGAAVGIVAATSGYDENNATTVTFNFNAASLTAGNSIVCIVLEESQTQTYSSVSNTQTNTYTHDVSNTHLTGSVSNLTVDVVHATVGSSSTNTVTFTYSGTAWKHVGCWEVTNLSATPIDGSAWSIANSAGPLTPSIANGVALALAFDPICTITGAGTGFTQSGSNPGCDIAEYKTYSSTAAITGTATYTSGGELDVFMVLYKGT